MATDSLSLVPTSVSGSDLHGNKILRTDLGFIGPLRCSLQTVPVMQASVQCFSFAVAILGDAEFGGVVTRANDCVALVVDALCT